MTIDMSTTRTDLALESVQAARSGAETGTISGVRSRERTREGYAVTDIRVEDEDGAQALGKPVGRYVTVDLGPYFRREADYFDRGVRCLAGELAALLPEGPVLAAGLGNRAMTCDAVGPASIDNLLVTRHMIRAMPRQFADFRPVAAVCPGVLARTGLEALELVRGAVERVRPAAVIAVDALAARDSARLCATVQLSDTGLVPGSGVGNRRSAGGAGDRRGHPHGGGRRPPGGAVPDPPGHRPADPGAGPPAGLRHHPGPAAVPDGGGRHRSAGVGEGSSGPRSVMLFRLMPRVDMLCSRAEVVGGRRPATPSRISDRLKPTMNR